MKFLKSCSPDEQECKGIIDAQIPRLVRKELSIQTHSLAQTSVFS